mgnify:CR=1 FL=1
MRLQSPSDYATRAYAVPLLSETKLSRTRPDRDQTRPGPDRDQIGPDRGQIWPESQRISEFSQTIKPVVSVDLGTSGRKSFKIGVAGDDSMVILGSMVSIRC